MSDSALSQLSLASTLFWTDWLLEVWPWSFACMRITTMACRDWSWRSQVRVRLRSKRGRLPALIGCGKGGNVISAGWPVTLCDPIWHVSSHSGEACLLTAILRLLLLYLMISGVARVQRINVVRGSIFIDPNPTQPNLWVNPSHGQLCKGSHSYLPTTRLATSGMSHSCQGGISEFWSELDHRLADWKCSNTDLLADLAEVNPIIV